MKRGAEGKRLQAQINSAEREKGKNKSAASEMERLRQLFPAEPGTVPFIETLHSEAKLSKLAVHDVTTASQSNQRNTSRSSGSSSDPLRSHRLVISVEGSFRNVAEYLRRVQNAERFKRITEIKLTPGKHGVSGNITLELFSLKDQHAR
jgi:hypothetical protein